MANIQRSSAENSVQTFIHSIEQGRLLPLIQRITLCVVVLAIALDYLGWKFRGFSQAEAMDQAQVSREITRGHGWSTKFIRPLALAQQEKNMGQSGRIENFPDTYNAPLPSLINTLPVLMGGDVTKFEHGELIAPTERFIAALSMIFFLMAVGVQYLLLRRYFDKRLAFWAAVLTLVSDYCWEWTLSGLPQIFMLLVFHITLYAMARAIEAQRDALNPKEVPTVPFRAAEIGLGTGADPETAAVTEAVAQPPSELAPIRWLVLAGALFGVLGLCHALALWLLVGAVAFSLLYFRQRAVAALALLIVAGVVYTPWMMRNYRVSGSAFGLAGYAIFDGVGASTDLRMRSDSPRTEDVEPRFFRVKIQTCLINQLNSFSDNTGGNLLAVMFFLSLLHPFRRPEVGILRWAILVIWLFAVFGMALLGNTQKTTTYSVNQLSILFLPIMISYGVAFVLVLFARLESSSQGVARLTMFSTLLLVSGLPMIFRLLPEQHPPYQYPPYLEPVISLLNKWTTDKEVIGSDMPWAVAWYADRKSLWIPTHYRDLMGLSDNAKLSGPLAGVFISPITRGLSYNNEIYKGDLQEYSPLILGSTNVPFFPFHEVAAPMGDLSYIFYSDTRRWEKRKADDPKKDE